MNNIVYELVNYGKCASIDDINATIDKIKELVYTDIDNMLFNIVDYLNNLKNNYTNYVSKLVDKYVNNSSKTNIVKHELSIFDDSVYLMSFGIIVDDVIQYGNSYMSAYSLLKGLENKFDEDNLKIYTADIDDYVACYLCLLNSIYSHGGGKNVSDILIKSYENVYLANAVYITSTYELYKVNNNEIQNLFMLLSMDVANNTDEHSKEYKKMILTKYLPIRFCNDFATNGYIGVILTYSPSYDNNRMFQIEDIPNVVYTCKSDWSKATQTITTNDTIELLNDLYTYEENIRHAKQLMYIKDNITKPWFHEDIDKRFTYLSITKGLTTMNVKLGDVLIMLKSKGSAIKKQGNKYPYVNTIDINNGISCYVDTYDTEADENNPVISIGMTHSGKGYAFVHVYNLAHAQTVILFKPITKSVNVYNIAFSITNHLTKMKATLPSYISARFVLQQHINIVVSNGA